MSAHQHHYRLSPRVLADARKIIADSVGLPQDSFADVPHIRFTLGPIQLILTPTAGYAISTITLHSPEFTPVSAADIPVMEDEDVDTKLTIEKQLTMTSAEEGGAL